MQIGAVFPQTEIGTDPAVIRDFARSVERAGYDYLLAYDHVLGAEATRFEGPIGGFPSAPYTAEHQFHEVLTLFAFLAAVTDRLRFATSVLILPQRQTALAAKQAAAVDILSGGRLRLAVGVGWNFAEYEALGEDFRTRGRRIEEQIRVMRLLWTERIVTYHGEYHHLDRVGINPLPVQRPIPLWIGSGASERSLRRVARLADGWIPLLRPHEALAGALQRLRGYAEEEGRAASALGVDARLHIERTEPDSWLSRVQELSALGITHLTVNSGRAGHTPDWHLERLRRFLTDVGGLARAPHASRVARDTPAEPGRPAKTP
jgi:probable F420-dependent oxidoreductase